MYAIYCKNKSEWTFLRMLYGPCQLPGRSQFFSVIDFLQLEPKYPVLTITGLKEIQDAFWYGRMQYMPPLL